MSGIIAIYNRDGTPVDPETLDAMCAAVPEHAWHGQRSRVLGSVGMAHQHLWVTPEEVGEEQPLVDEVTGIAITADARIDNREELYRKLSIERSVAVGLSEAELILYAYRRWGEDCTDHLLGDFAFVVWDPRLNRLFVARDAMGNRGLVFWESANTVCLATDISHLLAFPAIPSILNEEKLADLLLGRYTETTSTYYRGILHIPPAHRLVVEETGLQLQRYWDYDPSNRIRYAHDEEYAEHLRLLLAESVQNRLRAAGAAGLTLSGGLDSTSLAAVLAGSRLPAANGGKLKTYSNVFDEFPECDERRYIDRTVDRFDIDATYINCDNEWTFRDIETWPLLRDIITTDPYPRLPIGAGMKARADGVRVLFSGLFGDSLFEGSRFWLIDMLRDGEIAHLARTLITQRSKFSWKRSLVYNGAYRIVPTTVRQAVRRYISFEQHAPAYVNSDFSAQQQAVTQRTRVSSGELHGDEFYRSRRRGLQLSVFSESLSSARRFYTRQGIEFQSPYRDRALAEYIIAIPADQLGFPAHNRYILRNAMRGRIPDSVVNRTGRTAFVPLMDKGLLEEEQDVVQQLLESSKAVERGYISSEWLDTVDRFRSFRYPEMGLLWNYLCVELWLRRFW